MKKWVYGALIATITVAMASHFAFAEKVAVATKATPKIDGILDEYGLVNSITDESTDPQNLSGQFGILWDDKNLYLGIKVVDDILENNSDGWWDDDNLEIHFDMNMDRSDTYGDDDWQLWARWNDPEPIQDAKGKDIPGITCMMKQTSDGYSMEFSVPWESLAYGSEFTPKTGASFGFTLAIDDDDDYGQRDRQLRWEGDSNIYVHTQQFGTVTLK